ncbi:uncharacterized protein G2W53_044736 [Senna tora]|uniref:Uncharacterized protein n=1 Tax=Senna tora TaxID=362788 RepID=A0A834W1G2_9FABA|nr:uncharacterized protein G2W53_044736 [Senna tora]
MRAHENDAVNETTIIVSDHHHRLSYFRRPSML